MNNIGRVIKDPFCNGYFNCSHNYNLEGAVIIAEGHDYIVVRCTQGHAAFANDFDKQLIDEWCKEKE